MNKFTEKLSTAVVTTKYITDYKSPILHVFHFEDGSWQFSGAEQNLADEDYKVVSLGEILMLDKTLEDLGGMEVGFEAFRRSPQDSWSIIGNN